MFRCLKGLFSKGHPVLNFRQKVPKYPYTRSLVYKQPKKIMTCPCCLKFGRILLVWLLICCLIHLLKENMLCKHKNGFFPIGEPILYIKEINQFYFE